LAFGISDAAYVTFDFLVPLFIPPLRAVVRQFGAVWRKGI
jgi:hypothetical protein